MTPKQTDFPSEREFWQAAIREIIAIISGRLTLDQIAHWLESVAVAGKPLDRKRQDILRGGLKLVLFAKRNGKGGTT